MKKHIIIAGVPRAGKSTAAQMIAKKYGYQHISMDSVIAGIEHALPETGINSDAELPADEKISYISSRMAPFLRGMMDSGEYNECDYGMVIDIYQLLPEDYVNFIDQEICEIYYFVTSEVTAEERFQILKKYDTPKDYTYYETDEDNRRKCDEIVIISKLMKEQCIGLGIPCFETIHERQQTLDSFINSLK